MLWLAVLAVGLVLPGTAVAFAADRHRPVAPVLAAGAGFLLVEASSLLLLVIAALSCDESCEDPPEVWSDNPDAWQWDGIAVAAGVSLAVGATALFALVFRRRRLALGALAVLVAAQVFAWSLAM